MSRKNIQELMIDLEKAGIVGKLEEKTINLSMSEKKGLYISGDDYSLDGIIFEIGSDFTIEIYDCEGCEVHAEDNCEIEMNICNGVVKAGSNCKIICGYNASIIAKNSNTIESGENSHIEVEDHNKISTLNSLVNIDGGKNNEVVIGTDFEYGSYVEYTINLGENSKLYFGSTSINIK